MCVCWRGGGGAVEGGLGRGGGVGMLAYSHWMLQVALLSLRAVCSPEKDFDISLSSILHSASAGTQILCQTILNHVASFHVCMCTSPLCVFAELLFMVSKVFFFFFNLGQQAAVAEAARAEAE